MTYVCASIVAAGLVLMGNAYQTSGLKINELNCEVCGKEIRGKPILIEVEGAVLRVCPECARFGRVVSERRQSQPVPASGHQEPKYRPPQVDAENYELVDGYGQIIKRARESLGLTQTQLGIKAGIKPSLIAKIEQERFYPDLATAKKIEHVLKVHVIKEVESP